MGELSHSLLYQTSFIEVAVYVPDGVEYPARPVDTGQSYFSTPSKKTVIFCLVLSMLMRMAVSVPWISELDAFCALAGKPSIIVKTGAITRPRKCLVTAVPVSLRPNGNNLRIASSHQGLSRDG